MSQSSDKSQRRGKTVQLGSLLTQAGGRSFRRRGFVHSQIVTDWPHIVGPSLASVTAPEQLRFSPGKRRGGTLTVRCDGSAAMELEYHKALVLERVNVFFGYGAVERIAIRQGPLPPRAPSAPAKVKQKPMSPPQSQRLDKDVKGVRDQELKDALKRLGQAIMTS